MLRSATGEEVPVDEDTGRGFLSLLFSATTVAPSIESGLGNRLFADVLVVMALVEVVGLQLRLVLGPEAVLVPLIGEVAVLLHRFWLLLLFVRRLYLFIATLARCFRLPTSFFTGFDNFTAECMFPL